MLSSFREVLPDNLIIYAVSILSQVINCVKDYAILTKYIASEFYILLNGIRNDLLKYKNKGHSKNECPLHRCGKWDLNPHANTDWGHLGLAWSARGNKFPLPQNLRFRAIPACLLLMIVIC